MVHNHVSIFSLIIALILFATANPLAHATFLRLNVNGQLCCNSTGNCPPQGGQGIPGVVVRLNCTTILGASVQVGQTTTMAQGRFNINIPNLLGSVLQPLTPPLNGTVLPCTANVLLPLDQTICPLLSTVNGVLVGVTQLVGVARGGLLQLQVVLNANVAGFVNLNN